MVLNNKVYDVLKWIALVALPAFAFFYGELAGIWSLPFAEEVPATITAVDLLLGVLLGVSSATYNKKTSS